MKLPSSRLLTIVPTRSRPESVAKVVQAWLDTDAFADADLLFVVDADDPAYRYYFEAYHQHAFGLIERHSSEVSGGGHVWMRAEETWKPLVPKLNNAAVDYARWMDWRHDAVGFAGDDHLPRTKGWARRYLNTLAVVGTGVVSCPDGYRKDGLPTQWAMTSDIVRKLGKMVPAPVDHLYCDDSIKALADSLGKYRYLSDVLIEHMHPVANKAEQDEQYRRVNSSRQYASDGQKFSDWLIGEGGLAADLRKLRESS